MNASKQPARMGRPPRFPDEGARIGHSLRLKPSIDKALREAAEKNSRSLAEEMEYRINESFRNDFHAQSSLFLSDGEFISKEKYRKDLDELRSAMTVEVCKSQLKETSSEIFALSMMKSHFLMQNDVFNKAINYLRNKFGLFADSHAHFIEFSIEKTEREIESAKARYNSARVKLSDLTREVFKNQDPNSQAAKTLIDNMTVKDDIYSVWSRMLLFKEKNSEKRSAEKK